MEDRKTLADIQEIAEAKKGALQDIVEAAQELDKLMYDYDPYEYAAADYSVAQAFEDIDTDPGFVVMELIRMVRDLME